MPVRASVAIDGYEHAVLLCYVGGRLRWRGRGPLPRPLHDPRQAEYYSCVMVLIAALVGAEDGSGRAFLLRFLA